IAAGATHALALKSNGTVWAWGSNGSGQLGDGTTTTRTTPVQVTTLGTAGLAISAHANISHAVKTDRTLWSWGDNTSGALADGTVRTWGANSLGQLGDGTTTNRNAPVQPTGPSSVVSVAGGNNFSIAVSSDGKVWTWGDNANSQLGDGTNNPRLVPTQISD